YLYWGLGDGGSRDDPLGTGQKLDTLLGKILRIDVDRREGDRAYAIPADNPFVGRADARGEIFAFGFRNPWQIAFDRDTGRLWAADVGQDLLEEVDIVTKGGNYGWSLREGTQPFGNRPEAGAVPIDPVWEYDHQVGKSITGGFVYRGRQVPALIGSYLYGDFVSGRLWALHLDAATGRATNREIPWSGLPIFGFGTDADGEAYVLTSSPTGQGVFRLAASDTPSRPAVPEAEVAAAFSDGVRLLFESRPAESARAFDTVVAARPALEPELWQRGIALYYAGRFADGRRQFEIHRGANPADVENVAWHFACVARDQGAEAARAALLPVGADARVPMREILALFEGRGTPEAVLAAADAGPEPALRNQRCYAHLYLGLHAEACGRDDDAKRHLRLAAGPYAMDHFMGRVAQLHVRLRGWGDTTDSR
ncbi:MAG: PQQ-dependent sugar dehydrogenase, partial [Planctomycetia bacterium]